MEHACRQLAADRLPAAPLDCRVVDARRRRPQGGDQGADETAVAVGDDERHPIVDGAQVEVAEADHPLEQGGGGGHVCRVERTRRREGFGPGAHGPAARASAAARNSGKRRRV